MEKTKLFFSQTCFLSAFIFCGCFLVVNHSLAYECISPSAEEYKCEWVGESWDPSTGNSIPAHLECKTVCSPFGYSSSRPTINSFSFHYPGSPTGHSRWWVAQNEVIFVSWSASAPAPGNVNCIIYNPNDMVSQCFSNPNWGTYYCVDVPNRMLLSGGGAGNNVPIHVGSVYAAPRGFPLAIECTNAEGSYPPAKATSQFGWVNLQTSTTDYCNGVCDNSTAGGCSSGNAGAFAQVGPPTWLWPCGGFGISGLNGSPRTDWGCNLTSCTTNNCASTTSVCTTCWNNCATVQGTVPCVGPSHGCYAGACVPDNGCAANTCNSSNTGKDTTCWNGFKTVNGTKESAWSGDQWQHTDNPCSTDTCEQTIPDFINTSCFNIDSTGCNTASCTSSPPIPPTTTCKACPVKPGEWREVSP